MFVVVNVREFMPVVVAIECCTEVAGVTEVISVSVDMVEGRETVTVLVDFGLVPVIVGALVDGAVLLVVVE